MLKINYTNIKILKKKIQIHFKNTFHCKQESLAHEKRQEITCNLIIKFLSYFHWV